MQLHVFTYEIEEEYKILLLKSSPLIYIFYILNVFSLEMIIQKVFLIFEN